jgi:hypothetical protein
MTEPDSKEIERVLIGGDLGALKPDARLSFYNRVCESLGLNPLTQPFEYIVLNGKMRLYAKKDATDQLRKINGVSVDELVHDYKESLGLYTVTARGHDKDGRHDTGTGAVNIKGLVGDSLANAIMRAETKSKRRLTLSICGLGFLDETEVESLTSYQDAIVPAKQVAEQDQKLLELEPQMEGQRRIDQLQAKTFLDTAFNNGKNEEMIKFYLMELNNFVQAEEITKEYYDAAMNWAKTRGNVPQDLEAPLQVAVNQAKAKNQPSKNRFSRLFALAKERKVPEKDIDQYVKETWGLGSKTELTGEQLNKLMKWVEAQGW